MMSFFYNLITIHEMHCEPECSETEDVQASIIMIMADMFEWF